MGDFLKSALGYLGSSNNPTKTDHEFVGQFIEVGSQTLRIRRVIAEGGFAVVFEAQDTSTGKEFALKRLISHDEATSKSILQEISILKCLCGHPHIVQFISAASIGQEKARHVGTEFLILTELCKGGELVDHMRKRGSAFPLDVVLKIFYQTCRAVQHMHKQQPPIIHRDLKVENLLLSTNSYIKLCDFGSCTTETYSPNMNWTALQRSMVQDECERNTTPMYRPPEILDLYQNYVINESMDIWALGCVLYYLCYNVHPFEDSAKLAILNANYNLPSAQSEYLVFHNLIKQMLLIDPQQRPSINEVVGELQELGNIHNVKLDAPVFGESASRTSAPVSATAVSEPTSRPKAPVRPPPPRIVDGNSEPAGYPEHSSPVMDSSPRYALSSNNSTPISQQPRSANSSTSGNTSAPPGTGMFGILRGGAGTFMKNIKEASNKVIETVSASMARTDLDFTYITSRVAVMSFPAEGGFESITHNRMEEVQAFLNIRHPHSYAVYNITLRPYRQDRFEGRLSQRGFDPAQAPQLRDLFEIMLNMLTWLQQSRSNVCVVHCMDGKAASATVACAFLCFCGLFHLPLDAMRMFVHRRCEPAMQPSQIRYVNYVCTMAAADHYEPHRLPVTLVNLHIAPVPLFNKIKNGCRPYVEVYRGNRKVYSTLQDYESMKGYTIEDGSITIPMNGLCLTGDLIIIIYHARASFSVKGKISPIKICQIQFHTGFISPTETQLHFEKHDLDQLDSPDHYPPKFHLRIDLVVGSETQKASPSGPMPWENFSWEKIKRTVLFTDEEELRHIVDSYRGSGQRNSVEMTSDNRLSGNYMKDSRDPEETYATPRHGSHLSSSQVDKDILAGHNQSPDFFSTVEWQESRGMEDENEVYASLPVASNDMTNYEEEMVGNLLDFSIDEDDTHQNYVSGRSPDTQPVLSQTNDFNLLDFGVEEDSVSSSQINTQTPSVQPSLGHFELFDPFANHLPSTSQVPSVAALLKPAVVLPRNATSAHDLRTAAAGATNPVMSTNNATSHGVGKKVEDPFSELGGLMGGGGLNISSGMGFPNGNKSGSRLADMQTTSPANGNVSSKSVLGSGYRYGGIGGSFQDLNAMTSSSATQQKVTPEPSPSHHPKSTSTATATASSTANYSRVNFSSTSSNVGTRGVRPKVSEGAFGEFLKDYKVGSSSSTSAQNQPRTMKEMRREQLVKETDPDKLKVNEWVEGKERNIRGLLCSLNSILWEGVRWKGVNMAELVSVDHVKRQYKNAIRCIHQDKWMGTEYENISRLITVELNDAMTEFEDEKNAAASGPMTTGMRMF